MELKRGGLIADETTLQKIAKNTKSYNELWVTIRLNNEPNIYNIVSVEKANSKRQPLNYRLLDWDRHIHVHNVAELT